MRSHSLAHGFLDRLPAAAGSCSGSWPPWRRRVAAMRPRVDFTTVTKPPTVQVINPPVRNIVRVVGQPSFIESLRAHVGLSQADRLYREVESWTSAIG